ncbi:MAG: hypothetical protein KDA92_23650, partial [Planctomycetales bacterium]|nr:hypothetical protein [Planctomycetales bacterium]
MSSDLETICLKCLEKQPGRRYATADEVAADLASYVAYRPIKARPVSRMEQAWRWCRRNAVLSSVTAVLFLGLAIGLLSMTLAWQRARANARAMRLQTYVSDVVMAQRAMQNSNSRAAEVLLLRQAEKFENEDLRGFEWHYLWDLSHHFEKRIEFEETVYYMATAENGSHIAVSGRTGWIDVRSMADPTQSTRRQAHQDCASGIAIDVQNDRVFSCGWDKTICLWTLAGKQAIKRITLDTAIDSIDLSRDNKLLAAALADGSVLILTDELEQVTRFPAHSRSTLRVNFSYDGKRLASSSSNGTIRIWSTQDWQLAGELDGYTTPVQTIAWSRDNARLLSAGNDSRIIVWDVANGQKLHEHDRKKGWSLSAEFALDSESVLVSNSNGTIDQLLLSNGAVLNEFAGHSMEVATLCVFDVAGESKILSCSRDGSVCVFTLSRSENVRLFNEHTSNVKTVAFSPDGKLLASSGYDAKILLRDASSGQLLHELTGHTDGILNVNFSSDGNFLSSAGLDGTVRVWSRADGWQCIRILPTAEHLSCVEITQHGEFAIGGAKSGTIRVWDVRSGQLVREWQAHHPDAFSIDLSPDSKQLASVGFDGHVRIWDLATAAELATFNASFNPLFGVRYSPSGKLLAVSCGDGRVQIWNAVDGVRLANLVGHSAAVNVAAFSPDESTLVTGSWDGTIKFWDLRTYYEKLSLPTGGRQSNAVDY